MAEDPITISARIAERFPFSQTFTIRSGEEMYELGKLFASKFEEATQGQPRGNWSVLINDPDYCTLINDISFYDAPRTMLAGDSGSRSYRGVVHVLAEAPDRTDVFNFFGQQLDLNRELIPAPRPSDFGFYPVSERSLSFIEMPLLADVEDADLAMIFRPAADGEGVEVTIMRPEGSKPMAPRGFLAPSA